jgi:hypothetical protein
MQERFGHIAELAPDSQRIIIFGGQREQENALRDIWTLDVVRFEWTSLPQLSGVSPEGLIGANAAVIGNQMLVFFGRTNVNTKSDAQNKVFVLDMSTNLWVWNDTFTPPTKIVTSTSTAAALTVTPAPSNSGSLKTNDIVGLVLGVAGFLVVLGFVGWFCFVERNCGVRRNHKPSGGALLPAVAMEMGPSVGMKPNSHPTEVTEKPYILPTEDTEKPYILPTKVVYTGDGRA